jgi:hypothetical protein
MAVLAVDEVAVVLDVAVRVVIFHHLAKNVSFTEALGAVPRFVAVPTGRTGCVHGIRKDPLITPVRPPRARVSLSVEEPGRSVFVGSGHDASIEAPSDTGCVAGLGTYIGCMVMAFSLW